MCYNNLKTFIELNHVNIKESLKSNWKFKKYYKQIEKQINIIKQYDAITENNQVIKRFTTYEISD